MTKLEKTMEIWNNVETVDDFLNFIENPDIDYMNWSASFADSNKSGYWIGARIKNIPDVAHLLDSQNWNIIKIIISVVGMIGMWQHKN